MNKLQVLYNRFLKTDFLKDSAVVLIGTTVSNFGSYLYHVFIGRILGPVQYGEFGALLSLFYLVNVPSTVLNTGLTKYFSIIKARGSTGEAKSFYIRTVKLILIAVIFSVLFVIPLMNPLSSFLKIRNQWNIVLLYGIFASFVLTVPNGSVLTGFQKFIFLVIALNIGVILRLAGGVAGAFFGVSWTLLGNMVSNLASFFVGLYFVKFLFKYKSEKFSISRNKILGYGLPVAIIYMATTSLFSMDVVLVKHFFNDRSTGIYVALSILGKIIYFASFPVTTVIFPKIAEMVEKKQNYNQMVLQSVTVVLVISSVISLFYFLFPVPVVNLLFGKAYLEAVAYLGWYAVFLSLYSVLALLTQVSMASGKTNVMWVMIAAALIQIVLIWYRHSSLLSVITINSLVTLSAIFVLSGVLFFRKL